ncbi:MAG: DUF4097 family beta strand repeat-containing protein [Eubacteriales bacterium]
MKNKSLGTVIVAVLLTVAGIALACAALIMIDFDFLRLSTDDFEEVTHVIEGDFDGLRIEVDTHDVSILPSEDGACRLVVHESEKVKFRIEQKGGVLEITVDNNMKWYDHIGISFGKKSFTLYLPENEYESLSVSTDTGNIDVPDGFAFGDVSLETDTGDVDICGVVCNALDIDGETGKIKLMDVSADRITAQTSTGDVTLLEVKCNEIRARTSTGFVHLEEANSTGITDVKTGTGKVSLNKCVSGEFRIETNTGDVKFDASDADEIWVKTGTGSVSGYLLTEKLFTVNTGTGKIDVPESHGDKRCSITTGTGNITIRID